MQRILNKREKIILYITISVIGFSAIFNFLVAPLAKKNELLNGEINITRVKLKKYILLLSQKGSIQNAYNKFSATFKAPAHKEHAPVAVLSELENLAKGSGINLIDIKPQAPKNSGLQYKEIFVDLKTEGPIEGYLKFIYSIERSLSLLRVKAFRLNSKPNTPALEGNFSISQLSLAE